MASFASEPDVRLRFQLSDTTLVTSDLVTGSIEDAHVEVLRFLDPVFDVSPAADGVVLGETLLAGAFLFRSLASKDAFEQKDLSLGGHRIQAGKRFGSLSAAASIAEEEAWRVLEPFLSARPPRSPLDVSDTSAVLGEE